MIVRSPHGEFSNQRNPMPSEEQLAAAEAIREQVVHDEIIYLSSA
jgi:hypothetical protein